MRVIVFLNTLVQIYVALNWYTYFSIKKQG